MKKNGFTLIEIIASLVIISLLLLVSVPLINEIIKNQKEKAYQEQINLIEKRSESWSIDNESAIQLNGNFNYYLELSRLVSENLIEQSNIKDPRTNEDMKGCVVIVYDTANNQHTYTYNEKTCDELTNEIKPTWSYENKKDTVEVNEPYYIPTKVTATSQSGSTLSVKGPTITKQDKIIDVMDTKTVGDIFKITYETFDPSLNRTFKDEYNVTVIDTKVPTILVKHPAGTTVVNGTPNVNGYFNSNHTIEVEQGSTYNLNNIEVIVNDNSCREGEPELNNCNLITATRTGSLSINLAGTYSVKYVASDKTGNIKELTVTINVVDKTRPTIESVTGNPTNWTNQNITLTVNASDNIAVTGYSFDNGATWQTGNQKVYSSNQTVNIKVKDYAGNMSDTYTVDITKIDQIRPVISNIVMNPTSWEEGNATVYINATDTISGIQSYSFDGGTNWQATNYKVYSGTTTVVGLVKDNAGNISYTSNFVATKKTVYTDSYRYFYQEPMMGRPDFAWTGPSYAQPRYLTTYSWELYLNRNVGQVNYTGLVEMRSIRGRRADGTWVHIYNFGNSQSGTVFTDRRSGTINATEGFYQFKYDGIYDHAPVGIYGPHAKLEMNLNMKYYN